jgi:autotransporter translocation and assembly factor TamB
VLVLVVVALVVVLWTPWGTRTALTFALDRYDALVPGGIGVDAVSGTLGGTLELEALELHDRNDNPLLAAEHVRLQLRLADLVGMTLGFDELALRGLVVHIGGEAQFGDLGPDGPPKPKIEGFVGPDMPLGFAGPVAIDGVTVLQHRDDGSTMALVDGALLRATLLSKGREAELRIDALSAVVAQNAIAVGAMNGVVTWADPVVRIDGLSMLSDRGILHETSVGLDAYQLYGDAVVHGLVDIAALAPDAELPIYGFVAVDVVAAGGEAHAWADVAITADPEVSLGLVLGGTVTPELDMGGTGILRLVPPGTKSPLVSLLAASIVRAPDQPMNAVLNVHCLGCDARAAVKARIDADGEATVVDARVVVADASVDAHATLRDRVLASARAQVEIPSVTNVRRELSPWIAMPEIGGSAGANATCTGGEARLDCTADVLALGLTYDQGRGRIERIGIDAKVALRDGKPSGEVDVRATGMRWGAHRVSTLHVGARGDAERLDVTLAAQAKGGRAELAAVIEPGPSTRIGLHALELDYRKLHVRLAKPSHATIGSGSATVDELRLLVDRGAIAFGGTVGPRSDANLSIERFDLRSLDALQLPVRLRGVVEARGELHGRPADPDVSLVLDANKLQVDEHVIGRIGTEIAMNGGRIETRVDWDPAPGESVDLQVRARMRPLDGPPGLVASAPLLVSLQAENLALTRLQPWLGEHTIAGKLDTTLEIRGTTRRPTITLAVDANGLAFDEMRLDDLTVDVGHDAGRVDVAVNAKAPWLDSLALTASAPVRVAGVAPYYVLDRRGRASVDMKIDGLEIAGLRGVAPALDITGRVDAEVTAKVDNAKIEGMHAELLAQNLRRAGERIATLSFAAEVGPDRAHGKLQASGPAARLVEVDVDVPLRIDLARLDAKWRRDAEHTVAVEIADADLAAIGRIAGIGGMSGHLGGTASLVGTPATPKIDVDLDGHRLAWSGHRVGELAIEVHHDGKRTRADVQQRRDEQSLRVTADVPIAINLVDGGMRWDQDGDHHLDVDAIAIDRDLLAAFVTMPEDLDFEVNAGVHARGHAESLAVNGQIRASIVADNGIDTPIGGNFDLTTKQQHVALVIGPFEDAAIEIEATAKAPLTALLQGDPVDWKAVPIVASLDTSRFPLAGIAGLLPNALAEPAGRLDVHFAADGTVGQPSLHGNAQLRGGAITVIPLRQRFDRVTLDASLDRQDIRLVKLSARSGSGTARVDGKLHLERGATKGNLDVVLAGLPIVRPGMPLMKLSTRASGVLDATGKRTEIDVVARGTTLDVFTASVTAPTALPLEDGIVYTDVVTRVGKREPTASAKEPVLPPDMSVRLKLADPIYVRGPQANMTWRGGVEIERTAGEKVRAHGALIADRGRINFLGRDFIVDSGRVTLPEQGDIDPYIALTAVTQTEEGEVTIDVHGRASRPELRLSSDPPMSESDVFALLVTGSSGADSEGEGGAVEAKAASLLAAFQNPVLQRELQDRVGIDRVGVSFGDTVDQPIVAVGKRVSRKIYLETRYHHNAPQFENNAEIHLEYSIKPPHWTIETFIGDAAKGGVEVWWRKRFGRPREPKPAKDATLSSRPPAR